MQSVNEVWLTMCKDIINHGVDIFPRGIPAKELRAYQTVVDMSRPILSIKARELGYKFMAAEAYWILQGDNRVESIAPYSKMISEFSDDGVTFFGAYGPKVIDQLAYVAACLKKDADSRQACINIWREKPGQTKDVPCTMSLQFIVRENVLHCIDTMRSSDVWLGWPYDVFNMSMITRYVALYLNEMGGMLYDVGNLYLTAGSQHIYQRDLPRIKQIFDDPHALTGLEGASVYQPSTFLSRQALMRWLAKQKDLGDATQS
tara:strand:- start:60 stop:839 length:780 start_codon:yes stop_codon:yes gene_type:complete